MNKRLLKKLWKRRPFYLSKSDLERALGLFGTEHEQWAYSLKIGNKVIDCHGRVSVIITQSGLLNDDLKLDNGGFCSATMCCSPVKEIR